MVIRLYRNGFGVKIRVDAFLTSQSKFYISVTHSDYSLEVQYDFLRVCVCFVNLNFSTFSMLRNAGLSEVCVLC